VRGWGDVPPVGAESGGGKWRVWERMGKGWGEGEGGEGGGTRGGGQGGGKWIARTEGYDVGEWIILGWDKTGGEGGRGV